MRIYIAGPMTGLPEFNFPAFNAAAAWWRAQGWEVINPAEAFDGVTDKPYQDYVRKDLADLKTCDGIAMLIGWNGPNARGSVWEHEIATERGLGVYYQYDADHQVWSSPFTDKAIETKPTNPKDIIGSDKLPLHLWPATATAVGSLALLEGALKYGRANFRAVGVRASIYYDACRRHLDAWFEGEEASTDSGVPHLGNALACLAILVEAIAMGNLNDDRNYPTRYRVWMDQMTAHVARLKGLYGDRQPKHYTIKDAE